MNRRVLGVQLWQWVVIILMFIGFNLMVTVPMIIQDYQQDKIEWCEIK